MKNYELNILPVRYFKIMCWVLVLDRLLNLKYECKNIS